MIKFGNNFTQFHSISFIVCEFKQIYHWITFSSYILDPCKKNFKKINSYVINKIFKFQVFCNLKIYINNKFMGRNLNNIQFVKYLRYLLSI